MSNEKLEELISKSISGVTMGKNVIQAARLHKN
jgi:hypothetical protein